MVALEVMGHVCIVPLAYHHKPGQRTPFILYDLSFSPVLNGVLIS